jgi:DNA invertase Pin-like site-specific DNA recombinase
MRRPIRTTPETTTGPSGPDRAAVYVRASTEHQQYSISNQLETIREYAESHRIAIVRTYLDPGRSGLQLAGRHGLQALLKDVESGRTDYSSVLVYDVSRWGRFQNTDESAFYDFTCRRAGIRVIYCAEPFEGYGETMAGLGKSQKRAMAGEYSRELSAKTWRGAHNMAVRGFKQGGVAGFGLRRLLVDELGQPKMLLASGERKAIKTNRIILVPGPREEVEIVWTIFDLYAHTTMSMPQIADLLNREGPHPQTVLKWTLQSVRQILMSEKYTGAHVWNRMSAKLGASPTPNPQDEWVRCERAWRPLITRDLFELAQRKRYTTRHKHSKSALKKILYDLLQKEKHLSAGLLAKKCGVDARTYQNHFGTLRKAFEAVGYCPLRRESWSENRAAVRSARAKLCSDVAAELCRIGIPAAVDGDNCLVRAADWTLYVRVVRGHFYQRRAEYLWRTTLPTLTCEYVLLAGLKHDNRTIQNLLLIPQPALSDLPNYLGFTAQKLNKYRIENLGQLYEAAIRWSGSSSLEVTSSPMAAGLRAKQS